MAAEAAVASAAVAEAASAEAEAATDSDQFRIHNSEFIIQDNEKT